MATRPVLVVEDDPAIREMLLLTLELEGIPVVAVNNGVDALNAIRLREPEVVLLDLHLPVLDGEDVLRILIADGLDVPVLLMTADPHGAELGPRDGVTGHIPKPFDLGDLLAAIELARPPGDSSLSA